jgi:hypothetical protein
MHSIVHPWRQLPLLVALSLASAGALSAQTGGAAAEEITLEERVTKAIKDYEAAKKDKSKVAQRRRMLGWLGELDHPKVTAYLSRELNRLARSAAGVEVLDAMAKAPRPKLVKSLRGFVVRRDANVAVRNRAAAAIVAFGDEATDGLIELAREHKDANRRRLVLQALSRCDSARVRRALAEMLTEGDHAARHFVLIGTSAVAGDPGVDRAREQCVKQGNLIVAATAWRQLAEQGNARAQALTLDVIERVYDTPDASAAAELVRGICAVGDADFYPALVRYGSVRGAAVKAALQAAARSVATKPDLIDYLIEEGIESDKQVERNVAKVLLSKAPAESLQPLVAKVRKQLRRNRKKVLDLTAGLHELLAKDPTWVQDLAELAAAGDLESRLLGLVMLLEMGSPAAISSAQKYTRTRAWELRSVAYRYLAEHRDVTSIPMLIARYGAEEGRLAHELDAALFVHTGKRCWSRSAWSMWWRKHKEGFALPHPDSVKGGGSTSGGQTVSYYDIPLVSSRIAFVVDHSGSMGAKVGTDRKRTRLDVAKEQLTKVVTALPKTHKVNLIWFESKVTAVWKEVKSLTKGNRRGLLEDIEAVKQTGGTNLFDGVEFAFDDPEIDTIYLLTDGQPSGGRFVDAAEIVEEVRLMNRTRQIVIHCISIGQRSALLQDLAALTGGTYKEVR